MTNIVQVKKLKKVIPNYKSFCLVFSIIFIIFMYGPILTNWSNSFAHADNTEPNQIAHRTGGIIVGIYDHSNENDISYWTGGNKNSYSAYKTVVDNDPESRFTSKTITDLSTSTLNTIDVLLLPDNAVPDSYITNVKNWFDSGRGIIGADSAACYLVYSGFLIPGYSGNNGKNTYWDYDSDTDDQKILIDHKITEDYIVNNTYSSVRGDAIYYKNKLPVDAICLSAKNSDPSDIYVVARDVPSYGRLVGLGPFDSPPSGLDEFIRDAIEWSAREYRFSIEPFDQYKYGVANDVVDYTFKILNQGSKNDTYDLELVGNTFPANLYESTGTTEISSIYITHHTNKDLIVRVTIPENADYKDTGLGVLKVTSRNNENITDESTFKTIIPHYIPWSDDFELSGLSNNWTINGTYEWAGVSKKTANSGAGSMFTHGSAISITSPPIDTRDITILEISFWVRRGGYFSEIPDDDENLIVEYLNASDTWIKLKTFLGGESAGEIFDETFKLTGSALHNHFKLRFRQTSGSGPGVDFWHIDDVYIGQLRIGLNVEVSDSTPIMVNQGQENVEMAKITALASKSDVKISNIKLNLTGSASSKDIDEVSLVKDVDDSGDYSVNDTILASGVFTSEALMFTGPWSISEGKSVTYLISYNISENASIGDTAGLRIVLNDIKAEYPATVNFPTNFQSRNTTITEKPDYLLVTGQDKAPTLVEQGQNNLLVMVIPLMALSGVIILSDLNLALTGTGELTDVSQIRLYVDSNSNSDLDLGTDELLSFGKSTGKVLSFSKLNFLIKQGTAEKLLLIFDINLTANIGNTIGVTLSQENVHVITPDLIKPFSPISSGPFTLIKQIDRLAPAAPIKLNITNITHNSITLSWEPNTEDDVVGYNIYRNTGSSPITWSTIIGQGIKGKSEYVDYGLQEQTEFYYVITAFDEVPNESEYSNVVNGTTLLGPREPEIAFSYIEVEIPEDIYDDSTINLHQWFKDPNGDILAFGFHGQKHIHITIFPKNGTVILIPEKNWNGEETVTFYAFDGEFKTFDQVKIIVTPVNDPPGPAEIISPKNNVEFKDNEKIDLFGTCSDPDLIYGDSLTFIWSSSVDGELGSGDSLIGIPLTIDEHQITLLVNDELNENSSMTITISILSTNATPNQTGDEDLIDEGPNKSSGDGFNLAIFILMLIIIICILIGIAFIWRRNKQLWEEYEQRYLESHSSQSHQASQVPTTPPSIISQSSQPVISSAMPYTKYNGQQIQGYTSKPKQPMVIDMQTPQEQLPSKTQ